jgi:hypothetical protein
MFWVEKVAEARLKEKTLVLAKRLWAHAIFLDFEQSVIKKCLGFLSIFIEKIGLNQGRLFTIRWLDFFTISLLPHRARARTRARSRIKN